jgi:hypothetical protein
MTLYLIAFCTTFVSIFLKGIQHKNVIHSMYWSTGITSYAMNVFDVLLVGLNAKIIIQGDYWYAFVSGTSAALGMVASIYVHDKFISKRALRKAHSH